MSINNVNQTEESNIINNQKVNIIPNLNTSTSLRNIPLDVSRDLQQYKKIYITKQKDMFRMVHCCEVFSPEYLIFGELPDGDKKLIFTCHQHYECEICKCDDWKINCCCCAYICCDQIIYQLDYVRNDRPFYTQGKYIQKGCYCCKCNIFCCCNCDCPCILSRLYLRENTNPDDPDFNMGTKKGRTEEPYCLCEGGDKKITYITQEGFKGPSTKTSCCNLCLNQCIKTLALSYDIQCGFDLEIDIEDGKGNKMGNIIVYNGLCSKKASGRFCYVPRGHFDINMPQNATSEEKFQIIADLIHFDVSNKII